MLSYPDKTSLLLEFNATLTDKLARAVDTPVEPTSAGRMGHAVEQRQEMEVATGKRRATKETLNARRWQGYSRKTLLLEQPTEC